MNNKGWNIINYRRQGLTCKHPKQESKDRNKGSLEGLFGIFTKRARSESRVGEFGMEESAGGGLSVSSVREKARG